MGALVKPDGVPLYDQIHKSQQSSIANNISVPEQKIRLEDELVIQFGICRMTVLQGMSDPVDEGLFYRRHGIGIP